MRKLAAVVSRVIDGKFVKSDEWTLKDIGIRVGGTILARYWKGIEADHSMVVVEVCKRTK